MRTGRLVVVVIAGVLAWSADARADPVSVALGTEDVQFTPADAGGGTAKFAVTNLTNQDAELSAAPNAPHGTCAVKLDKSKSVPAARTVSFTATATPGCGKVAGSFGIRLSVPGQEPLVVTAVVKPPENPKPDWGALKWFEIMIAVMAALMLGVYFAWCILERHFVNPLATLPYLDSSWSFSDSWVSNITVVGGLLAGVFGTSEVVKAMLGEDADTAVALATIGGAVSVAIIGGAGVLVVGLKGWKTGKFTAVGVLIGSALALGAAGGQLIVVYIAARKFDLGGVEKHLAPALMMALGLLVIYGCLSVFGVLVQGHTAPADPNPETDPLSDTLLGAALVAGAIDQDGHPSRHDIIQVIERLQPVRVAAPATQTHEVAGMRALMGNVSPAYTSGRSALP